MTKEHEIKRAWWKMVDKKSVGFVVELSNGEWYSSFQDSTPNFWMNVGSNGNALVKEMESITTEDMAKVKDLFSKAMENN